MSTKLKRSQIIAVRKKLLERQNNRCDMCCRSFDTMTYNKKLRKTVPKFKPCLDHDHTTGVIRGVLCNYCNSAEGKILKVMKRYHYIKTDAERAAWNYHFANYMDKHRRDCTGLIHPDHKTEEEKRVIKNEKARRLYKASLNT